MSGRPQIHCRVDHQTLGAPDAEVGMDERDAERTLHGPG
jgi:hypothetical protein